MSVSDQRSVFSIHTKLIKHLL